MRVPSSYFEPDVEPDFEYIHLNDHYLTIDRIGDDVEQLIDELYNGEYSYDKNVVHAIICELCKHFEFKKPELEKLKI